MSRHLKNLILTFLVPMVLAMLCAMPLVAQPEKAEAIFTEATTLANAADSVEKFEAAFKKYEEAYRLFNAEGDTARAWDVTFMHGKALRSLAVLEMNAKHYSEAVTFFEQALKKVQAFGDHPETAYVYHDLGYVTDQLGKSNDALKYYSLARDEYRQAGDQKGESVVLRNIGILRATAGKNDEAIAAYEESLKLRIATADAIGEAEIQLDIGEVHRTTQDYLQAAVRFEKGLKLYLLQKDKEGEATARYKLGEMQSAIGRYADAVTNLTEALNYHISKKDLLAEANTVEALGRAQISNGKYVEAERRLLRATEIFRQLKEKNREAAASLDLAIAYQSLSRLPEAQHTVANALQIFRDVDNPIGEAYALIIYSEGFGFLNQYDEALAKLEEARTLFREHKVADGEYRIMRALSTHNHMLSNYGEAIRYATAALVLAKKENDVLRLSSTYVDLANAYSSLGQEEKSIEFTNKALEIARQLGSKYMESVGMSNVGYSYLKMRKFPEAKAHLQKAIAMMQANGFDREQGYATHNLGLVYYKLKQYNLALANYDRAHKLYLAAGDRRPQAFLHDSYGELYRDIGLHDKALVNLQKAVVMAREIKYNEIEAQALGNLMTFWTRRRQPRLAVLYGKQAVNVYQTIRKGNASLDKAEQKSFVASNEKTYRQLANVLIEEGRLAEAQQVLDLLKAEEYFEFVRRDSSEASEHATLALSESERSALDEYSRVSSTLTAAGVAYQKLLDERIRNGGKLDAAKEAEYLRLKTQVETAGEGLKTFFAKLASEFSKKVEDGTVVTPQSIETLKADLRRAGPDVVLVSTYLLPERYRAIVTTGRTMVDRKVEYSAIKLTSADINRKIFEFQRALQNPKVDPRKLGKELYDIFVKPLEEDLRGAGAKTILWSLDGSLRYIPLAALSPDGKTYLAEHYQNVVVTLGRQTNLFAKPTNEEWRAIGAGVSKQHTGFSPLPSVPAEIGSIVRDEKSPSQGILDGTRMLDEQFNLEALRNTVPQQTEDGKAFNVLHLATHFSLGASDQDSALLLGDGTRLSLFEIGRDEALDFKDVELLTLSACQTGVSTGDANGREVESLGMLAQKKGAKAVLATLWKVADESTSLFMQEFYKIKKADPKMNKAEAIRLAQKEMIDGKIKNTGTSGGCRAEQFGSGGKKDDFKCDPNAPYSHPYFWSPFVLIGNWR